MSIASQTEPAVITAGPVPRTSRRMRAALSTFVLILEATMRHPLAHWWFAPFSPRPLPSRRRNP
jgi:hypothetical protein